MRCEHENVKSICRLVKYVEYQVEDTDHRVAEITIECADCGAPFHFVGPDRGLSPHRPMISPFGEELRAPIVAGEIPKGN